jgi:hypothetical protein
VRKTTGIGPAGPFGIRGIDASSPQFFIHQCKYRRRDAYNYEGRNSPPYGIRFGKFPDRENTEDSTGDQGRCDDNERYPANDLRIKHASSISL